VDTCGKTKPLNHGGLLEIYQLENIEGEVKLDLVHRNILKRVYVDPIPAQQWYKPSYRKNRYNHI